MTTEDVSCMCTCSQVIMSNMQRGVISASTIMKMIHVNHVNHDSFRDTRIKSFKLAVASPVNICHVFVIQSLSFFGIPVSDPTLPRPVFWARLHDPPFPSCCYTVSHRAGRFSGLAVRRSHIFMCSSISFLRLPSSFVHISTELGIFSSASFTFRLQDRCPSHPCHRTLEKAATRTV